jgi:hypothetical protein
MGLLMRRHRSDMYPNYGKPVDVKTVQPQVAPVAPQPELPADEPAQAKKRKKE